MFEEILLEKCSQSLRNATWDLSGDVSKSGICERLHSSEMDVKNMQTAENMLITKEFYHCANI